MTNFYLNTIQKDHRFMSIQAINDLGLLEPTFRSAIMQIIAEAKAQGHEFRVGETYRSRQRQADLFRKGATRLRNVGVHHYGLACDLHLIVDGQFESRGDRYYPILYPLCVKYKQVYGADWGDPPPTKHSFNDWDHIQRISLDEQPGLFSGAWYPDDKWVSKKVG